MEGLVRRKGEEEEKERKGGKGKIGEGEEREG